MAYLNKANVPQVKKGAPRPSEEIPNLPKEATRNPYTNPAKGDAKKNGTVNEKL